MFPSYLILTSGNPTLGYYSTVSGSRQVFQFPERKLTPAYGGKPSLPPKGGQGILRPLAQNNPEILNFSPKGG